MHIRQDAEVKTAVLQKDASLEIAAKHKINYVHVIEGCVQIGEYTVNAGDALVFEAETEVKALADSRMIWFDLP